MSEENVQMESQDVEVDGVVELEDGAVEESEVSVDTPFSDAESVEAESVEELQDEIEQAIEDGASQEEVQNMVKQFKLKVNGKEFTKEIDLNDEESLKRELQMAHAGRDAMQRARELEKEYAKAIEELRADPASVFKELGMDFNEISEQHLRAQLEEMNKSPEELEREQMQRELERFREEASRAKEESERIQYEQAVSQQKQELNHEIEEALSSHSDLPPSQKTYQKIAETMMWAIDQGYDDVRVEDVIPVVKNELREEMSTLFEQMPVEMFEQYIGKKNMGRLREQRISRAKKGSEAAKVKETAIESVKQESKKKIRAKDYFRNLGKS